MAVDWVAIKFEVAAPYVLAHGINADRSTWDEGGSPGALEALNSRGVLYERFSVTSNGRSAGNAVQLRAQINAFLNSIKSKKVHIIAHSKGGLDTQEMAAIGTPFKILSLSTLSTPHLGTVAGDLSVIQQTEADERINSGSDPNGFVSAYVDTWTFGQGPQLPGLRDLTTYSAATALGSGFRGNINPTFTFGANADLNGNGELENSEAAGLFPVSSLTGYGARRSWNVMRNFASASVLSTTTVSGKLWGSRTTLTYTAIETGTPQENDIVVTLRSANPAYGIPSGNSRNNHGTIKNRANINTILDKTIPLQ
jgi:pimeloyl-ACP methyl ester carboxylesterase